VQPVTADPSLHTGPANAKFTRMPVYAAGLGAQVATGKMSIGFCNAPGQFAIPQKREISGFTTHNKELIPYGTR
jgi:hypothetical protein